MSDNNENEARIPLSWGDMARVPTVYANQLLITHSGNEFYLVFGELFPPLVTDQKHLPESIEINPIIKVAITRENMVMFASLIEENVANFLKKVRMNEDEEIEK